jgi:hypothetical protein
MGKGCARGGTVREMARTPIPTLAKKITSELAEVRMNVPGDAPALTSTSRFRINLELYASMPLSNMVTPPTYTILIQHLHVIYDILLTLVIGVFLRPRGEPGVTRVTG